MKLLEAAAARAARYLRELDEPVPMRISLFRSAATGATGADVDRRLSAMLRARL